MAPQTLKKIPGIRQLQTQATALVQSGDALGPDDARAKVAQSYGFESWRELTAHKRWFAESDRLKRAIDRNDLAIVQAMMGRNPALHRAPIGYGQDGPITWVAECRVPRVPPSPTRLAMAKWMIENGSDIHRGGDAPLMRAALDAERVPMMELLVSCGADVNAAWHDRYPIIFATCEALNPESLEWLLQHGADPNCGGAEDWAGRGFPHPGMALDYALGTYARDAARLAACVELLLAAGGRSKFENPALLAIVRGRLVELHALLDADPSLLHQQFSDFDLARRALALLRCGGARCCTWPPSSNGWTWPQLCCSGARM